MSETKPIASVCVYCGSSNAADPGFLEAAATFGTILASENLRLVYGGGGVGLMGACARAVHDNGGQVLGVMPSFLQLREVVYDAVETIVVESMHERKMIMFDEADAFVVLPGGIGTLEEVVELMSWRRLALHSKPLVFLDIDGYWQPFFGLLKHTVEHKLTPPAFLESFGSVATAEEIVPALREMAAGGAMRHMPLVT